MDRGARSRTNSTSSLRSPAPPTPSHTPNAAFARLAHANHLSPDQLVAGISRIRAEQGSRSSSIPATPAPTPNPLLHVTYHMVPEQLAAGINNLKVDEGYVDSTSFPGTPAPSPFSPSPAQFAGFTPDQVAEGIRRLREEGVVSGASTGQPPTPSTTPGPGVVAFAPQQQLGVIPEHLAESINHLRKDEGLESGSNPATPIPTPISPSPAANRLQQILPEQLAAGIHRLKVEEGMSSGGSSGFPSTPAPTPFIHHPGGVRPEDLAAGISRLSVIEEGDVPPTTGNGMEEECEDKTRKISSSSSSTNKSAISTSTASQPELSQYFGGTTDASAASTGLEVSTTTASQAFFDQINEPTDDAVLHSCRESRVDLTDMGKTAKPEIQKQEAELDVVEQSTDDVQSLRRRQSSEAGTEASVASASDRGSDEPSVCTFFQESQDQSDPFDSIGMQQPEQTKEEVKKTDNDKGESQQEKVPQQPTTLAINNEAISTAGDSGLVTPTGTAAPSLYSTPIAPTPNMDQGPLSYPSYQTTSTPLNPNPQHGSLQSGAVQLLTPGIPPQFHGSQPITSPLPNTPLPVAPAFTTQFSSTSSIDESLIMPDEVVPDPENSQDAEGLRRNHAWIPNQATSQILQSIAASTPGTFYPDRATLTMPGVVIREDLVDPVRNLVAHYRGESEAVKRQVLTADSVTQDQRGLRQLVKAGCFRAAVNLTGRLLQMYNQGAGQGGSLSKHTPSSLQIWFTRLSLLVKLRQFSVAEVEAEPFGDLDRPDLYFQFYPEMYPSRQGSMVPFGFRVLLAELPQYLGKQHETLDRLYGILSKVKKILANLARGKAENGNTAPLKEEDRKESQELWKQRELRILYSLCNCAITQKDFELAVENLQILLEAESKEKLPKILSALGRVYLQLGDIDSAQSTFSKAYKLRRPDSNEDKCDNFLDMAALSIANSDYENALATLKKALEASPTNGTAVNNIAVCYLYLGRLKEGLSFLEAKITGNPGAFLQETPILNLCTLYELESSYAGQKKRGMLDLVSQYKGDGINPACLKLQL